MEINYNELFTTYQQTDPPPIITPEYKKVKDTYENYILPMIYPESQQQENISFLEYKQNPLQIETEPPRFSSVQVSKTDSQKAVDIARQFVGTKYSWGGISPSTGFDCSGLIKYVYKQVGIDLPRTAKEMSRVGTEVPSLNDVQIGDLICSTSSGPSGNHVQLVSRIDNGQIYTIEARGKKDGIIESPLNNLSKITTIRRLNKESKFNSRKDFVNTMYRYLHQALENNGLDGDIWAPTLTAHTTIESNWGNSFSRRTNNYAGIKGKGSGSVSTQEWDPSRGYYTIKDSFKSYPNIEAFADDFVKRLKNKFRAFDGTPQQYVSNIRKHGYFTDSLSHYQGMMNSRLNTINRLLSS